MNDVLERAKSGDRNAFDELIKPIEKDLWRMVNSRLIDKSYTDDVLQIVLYTTYAKLSTLKDDDSFYVVYHNVLIIIRYQ